MYRGRRDSMLGIVVNQTYCQAFTDRSGKEWVEVFVPPYKMADYSKPWSSIAVPPEQVNFIDNTYNEVFVNSGALLTGLYKMYDSTGVRVPSGKTEQFTSEEMLSRFLQLEAVLQNRVTSNKETITDEIYKNYMASGLKMHEFIIRGC